jgi:site-specific DNA recombinase
MGTGSERLAVLYAAKSTEDTRGSITGQLEDCRAYAAEHDLTVKAEYSEADVSAYKGNRGPELAAALAHVERLAGALIVQHSDRLARGDGTQARHLVEVALWARRVGVEVRSVQDPSTFDNIVLAAVMGERNMEDSRRKSAAVKAGLARRRMSGRIHGPSPFGYRWHRNERDERVVIPDPDQVPVVRRIYSEFLAGRPQLQIARALNHDRAFTARGRRWSPQTVRTVLTNPTYAGLVRLSDGALIEGRHAQILPRSMWEKAQAVRSGRERARHMGRPPRGRHLFRKGLLRCGICGAAIVPRTERNADGSLYDVYRCYGRALDPSTCSLPPQQRESIDAAVLEALGHATFDLGPAAARIAEDVEKRKAQVCALLEDAGGQVELAAKRLARVRGDYVNGEITAEEWRELRVELEPEVESSLAERARLAEQLLVIEAGPDVPAAEMALEARLDDLVAALARPCGESRVPAVRDVLLQLFDRFVFHRTVIEPNGPDQLWLEPVMREVEIDGYDGTVRPVFTTGATPLRVIRVASLES